MVRVIQSEMELIDYWLEDGRGPSVQESRQPLEIGKDKEMDSSSEPTGEIQPHQYLDFSH